MPKKLNDINLILPKNRYNSSTTRRNIQSAMNKIRNKLPKINNALVIEKENGRLVLEVALHIGEQILQN